MAGPSASGSLIYADNPFALADFYAEICQLEELHRKEDMVVLKTPGGNLVIHQSPIMMSGSTRPPEERPSAIKLFFTVDDISKARNLCVQLGGRIKEEMWQGPNFCVSNAVDPEGNIFQVRWHQP